MNMKIASSIAVMALALDSASAIFLLGTTAAGTAATTSTLTLAGGSGTALALGGGILLLKGLAIGALALAAASRNRGRREALEVSDSDAAFFTLAASEPAQCYRRLICDLATGALPKSENEVILGLFKDNEDVTSPKFDFAVAKKLGKELKNVHLCELRYSCPLTGSQIEQLF